MTYSDAYLELEKLVLEIEDEDIQLDALSEKVKKASALVRYCEQKLRDITTEINEVIED